MDKTWAVKAVLMAVEALCHIYIYTHFLGPFLGIVAAIKPALSCLCFPCFFFFFFNQQYSIKMICFVFLFWTKSQAAALPNEASKFYS